MKNLAERDAARLKLSAGMTSRLRGQLANISSELARNGVKPLGRVNHSKKSAP